MLATNSLIVQYLSQRSIRDEDTHSQNGSCSLWPNSGSCVVRSYGLSPCYLHRGDLDHTAGEQSGNQSGHSVVRRSDGLSFIDHVAIYGRQMGAAEYLTSAASLSTGHATTWPGIRLGPGGRLVGYGGPGRVLDRVVPAGEDTWPCATQLLWLSFADCGTRAVDGSIGFYSSRGSRFPGILPGLSGTKGERPGCHRNRRPAHFAWTQPYAGVLVAHNPLVLFRGCDVGHNCLPYKVDSAGHRGSRHWPPGLLHPGMALRCAKAPGLGNWRERGVLDQCSTGDSLHSAGPPGLHPTGEGRLRRPQVVIDVCVTFAGASAPAKV